MSRCSAIFCGKWLNIVDGLTMAGNKQAIIIISLTNSNKSLYFHNKINESKKFQITNALQQYLTPNPKSILKMLAISIRVAEVGHNQF
jgi:hypothetical protein